MDEETFLLAEKAEATVLSCVKVQPVNKKFADELNHRDYLGSLMNLGIERDQIGDILTGDDVAYVFATFEIAQMICKELIRIRHTSVKCEIVNSSECDIRPKFEEISGSVASERIDAILAFVYHLSRSEAQKLIESESVFIDEARFDKTSTKEFILSFNSLIPSFNSAISLFGSFSPTFSISG